MAQSKPDRIKASKLRKKPKRTAAQEVWLRNYDAAVAATRQRRKPSKTPVATGPRGPRELAAAPVVRGPQLAMPVVVQQTQPPQGAVNPSAHTWVPKMPALPEGAEPAPPGTPPQPDAGTPLVDAAIVDGEPVAEAQPHGDPAAAQQFAALMVWLTHLGIKSAFELSETMPVPDGLREMAFSTGSVSEALSIVHGAAERVAMKYGFRSVPMADEAIVLGAAAGSVLVWRANLKRKKKLAEANPANAPTTPTTKGAMTMAPEPQPPPSDDLNDLWNRRRP